MKRAFLLYNIIDQTIIDEMGVLIEKFKFYTRDNISINHYYEDGCIVLEDEYGQWTPDKYLKLEGKIIITNPNICFFDKYRVAFDNSILGIGLKIVKNGMYIDNVFITDFNKSTNEISKEFCYEFLDDELFDNIKLEFYIFIKQPSNNNQDDFSIANAKGIILGSIYNIIINIDGKGSELPIVFTQKHKNDPLWELEFNYEDACVDKLCDCYKLIINTANEDFKYIDNKPNNELFNRSFLNEIIAETIIIVLRDVANDITYQFSEFEEGSIAQFVEYLKNDVLDNECNINDMNQVSYKLRKILLKRIK